MVAARLRKDAVTSQLRTDTIDQLLKQVREDETNNAVEEFKSKKHKKKKKSGDREHEKEAAPVDKTEVRIFLFYNWWMDSDIKRWFFSPL